MAIKALSATAAAPSLPLFRARIARTHRNVLATVFVLTGEARYTRPWQAAAGVRDLPRPWQVRQARLLAPWLDGCGRVEEARRLACVEDQRGLGEALQVLRFVEGGILGTRLDLLMRETVIREGIASGSVLDIQV